VAEKIYTIYNKKTGMTNSVKQYLKKELIWFAVVLIAFLGVLTMVSQEDGGMDMWAYVVATTAFTFIWIIKSYLIKGFITYHY